MYLTSVVFIAPTCFAIQQFGDPINVVPDRPRRPLEMTRQVGNNPVRASSSDEVCQAKMTRFRQLNLHQRFRPQVSSGLISDDFEPTIGAVKSYAAEHCRDAERLVCDAKFRCSATRDWRGFKRSFYNTGLKGHFYMKCPSEQGRPHLWIHGKFPVNVAVCHGKWYHARLLDAQSDDQPTEETAPSTKAPTEFVAVWANAYDAILHSGSPFDELDD